MSNKQYYCLCCLTDTKPTELIDMKKKGGSDSIALFDVYVDCSSVTLDGTVGDEEPKICINCAKLLQNCYNFRLLCRTTYSHLKTISGKTKEPLTSRKRTLTEQHSDIVIEPIITNNDNSPNSRALTRTPIGNSTEMLRDFRIYEFLRSHTELTAATSKIPNRNKSSRSNQNETPFLRDPDRQRPTAPALIVQTVALPVGQPPTLPDTSCHDDNVSSTAIHSKMYTMEIDPSLLEEDDVKPEDTGENIARVMPKLNYFLK